MILSVIFPIEQLVYLLTSSSQIGKEVEDRLGKFLLDREPSHDIHEIASFLFAAHHISGCCFVCWFSAWSSLLIFSGLRMPELQPSPRRSHPSDLPAHTDTNSAVRMKQISHTFQHPAVNG